jgi:polysaccharide export outer membrane protein
MALTCLDAYGAPPTAYRIAPNDILTITVVAGGQQQYNGDLTVSAQGTIKAPFIGEIPAEGLTATELEEKIAGPLEKNYFVNPTVDVTIKEYHRLHYYISGAVNSPGVFEAPSRITLLELIAKAGGVLPDRGTLAYIIRDSASKPANDPATTESSKEPLKVNLTELLEKGDLRVNPVLESGDVVYIPLMTSFDLAESKIYVEGEVKSPGIYDYRPGMTALSACILAGGFNTFAAANRTRIIRKKGDEQEIIKIDLYDVRTGKIPDVELKPGDRIHIPETWL